MKTLNYINTPTLRDGMGIGLNIYGVAIGSLVLAGVVVGASIWKPMILRGLGWVNTETSAALTGAGENGGLF